MTAPDSELHDLPLDAVLRINAICDAYEAQWRAGRSPRAEDHLGDTVGPERTALLHHLAQVDAEYRPVSVEEFARRLAEERLLSEEAGLPIGATAAEWADALVAAGVLTEFQARNLLGTQPIPLALNDYVILDRLGAGGMGTVYRAMHRRMKRSVALKLIADGPGADGERGRWFQHEMETAGRLVHPHIVTAYDAGEARGLAYLVSEYVEGDDLHQQVTRDGPLSVAEAARAVRDAALGLAHAHGQGVVHCDVKPSNLIRDSSGTVRVLDVGLAKLMHADGAGRPSAIVGTPGYMAPEQSAAPESVDTRADIYGLGATLYYLLTGRPMFAGGTATQRLTAQHDGEAPTLSDAATAAPPALEQLYQRMTAREVDRRPASMLEVVYALDHILEAPRRRRRRAALLTGAGLATAALVALWTVVPRGTVAPPAVDLISVPFDAVKHQAEWARAAGMPVEIEPRPGLRARLIPPGRFQMGTPVELLQRMMAGRPEAYLRDRLRNESPRPESIATAFYITSTELTVAQFRQFVEAQSPPYETFAERPGSFGYRLDADHVWKIVPGGTWRDAGLQPVTDEYPVCNLGRDDCIDYCNWLTTQLAGRYVARLPTEAEWEYACRAGSDGLWCCGNDAGELPPFAWFDRTVPAEDSRLKPVGRKSPNSFGLFDMHGNIAEWCSGTPVLRGGNIRSPANDVRSASRDVVTPTEPRGGLRVVLEPRQ